jgi:methionine synthase I (cobalamin-dependent)
MEGSTDRFLSLISDRPIITDGAWGTEFQMRGLASGELADLWNLTRPADVEAVARAYVQAGSRAILTNIKPSAGLPTIEAGRAVYSMTPEAFAGYLPGLIEAGASFVGGCCGTTPEFIRALARAAGPRASS